MNGRSYVQSIAPRVLGSDEHILPREPAFPHGSSRLRLVAVYLCSVCRYNTRPRSVVVTVARAALRRPAV